MTASGNFTVKFALINESKGKHNISDSYYDSRAVACSAKVEGAEVPTICDGISHVNLALSTYEPQCVLSMKAVVVPTASFSEVELAFAIPTKAREDWALGCSSSDNTWEFSLGLDNSAWSTEYPNYETVFAIEELTTTSPSNEIAEVSSETSEASCAEGSECASRCEDKIGAFETCLADKEQHQKDSCISCIRDETILNDLEQGVVSPEQYVQHVCVTGKARGCPSVCDNCFEAAQEIARCAWACDLTADDPSSSFTINNELECGPGSKCEERCEKHFNDVNACLEGMSDGEFFQCFDCLSELDNDKVGKAFTDHYCANVKGCLVTCDKCSAQFSQVNRCAYNCDSGGSQPQKTEPRSSKRKYAYKNLLLELQNAPLIETDAGIAAWVQVTELFYLSYFNNGDGEDSKAMAQEKRQKQLQAIDNFSTRITFHNQSALVYYTGKRVNRLSYSQTMEYTIPEVALLSRSSSSTAANSSATEIDPDQVLMLPFMDKSGNGNNLASYVEQLKEQLPALAESDIVATAPVITEPAVASSSFTVWHNNKYLTIAGGMMVSAFLFGFS